MRTRIIVPALALAMAVVLTPRLDARTPAADPAEDINQALLWLPYYGPFDALRFHYDKGTVTLEGRAYASGLAADAERAVRRVPGVERVVNAITPLPASPNDDRLRWRTFDAIYTNDFLSRYAPGGGWGLRDRRVVAGERQLGLEPIGTYPIHIIVEHGHVELVGWVASDADRAAAGMAARGVPGAFGVENRLQVYPTS
ncbi:MAG: BON domain-containing protein [Vicinamibacterales bacterium]